MGERYFHNKLIRDGIPKLIEANGGKYEVRVLNEAEFDPALKQKLVEEAKELQGTDEAGLRRNFF